MTTMDERPEEGGQGPKARAKYGKANLLKALAKLNSRPIKVKIVDVMTPVSPDKGSRFGEDVIRITGSDRFCSVVLSRLSEMIEIEHSLTTRLDCAWQEVDGNKFTKGSGGNSIYLRMALRRK